MESVFRLKQSIVLWFIADSVRLCTEGQVERMMLDRRWFRCTRRRVAAGILGILFAAGFLLPILAGAQETPETVVPAGEMGGARGVVRDAGGAPLPGVKVTLKSDQGQVATVVSGADGRFHLKSIAAGSYSISVVRAGRSYSGGAALTLPLPVGDGATRESGELLLTLSDQGGLTVATSSKVAATSGEDLSGKAVSSLPLNKRDFSQLLLLAAGTMTDTNGATNFTEQFAIDGQRGVEAVFAMDGADISDPEMGGATFTNFDVDAIEGIQSSSGWMPAEIGRGASGFTNILTRSGSAGFHGSAFEFVRNSAFDARNYFDYSSPINPGRLPPFRRNEFGFTNGGPILLPHLYNGHGKTFYFGQYQGFRQVLGTTQVLPVPTAQQRAGTDVIQLGNGQTDTLQVPVNPQIAAILARYPLPNLPSGAYGAETFATSSKVTTNANQFSLRLDHQVSSKTQLTGRYVWDHLTGPTTNPDQTTIDPAFGIQYVDHQSNGVVSLRHEVSPRFTLMTSLSATRTTPGFPTADHTDPAVKFNDGSFEPFDSAGGSVMSAFGNLFQGQQSFEINLGKHLVKFGGEARLNRDTTYFGISPNGEYDFGGGTAYSPVFIPSASGQNNVQAGAPLPDTLSSFLVGSPFQYTVAVAPPYFSNGTHIGPAAINRNAWALYAQDTWKMSERVTLDYGLRWELYTPISERAKRTSGLSFQPTPGGGVTQQYVINPQPGYRFQKNGFMPRVQVNWAAPAGIQFHAGGGITVIPPNIWQDNFLTGSTPFVVYPHLTSAQGAPIPYGYQITPSELPPVYTPQGQNIFANGNTKAVPANTVMDLNRYEQDLAALTPSKAVAPLALSSIDPTFGNAWLYTWTLGLERKIGDIVADAAYVGTAGVRLPRVSFPNAYLGAGPAEAPYTNFNSAGNIVGGFGFESVITDTSHSTYHALQTSLQGTFAHGGPGVQAGYTWSKSLDDTSSVTGGFISGATGAVAPAFPQNPTNTHAEKGPSTFDVTHSFTLSVAQDLHGDRMSFLHWAKRGVTEGWELLSISSIASGSPFTVLSGVQQTGYGANGVDRPDQIGKPNLSTARKQREDYFGLGANNASYFSIPIHIAGGTGPNQGRFGTLGRNTFRGPAYYDFDYALIKDTPYGHRRSGTELVDVQFRGEFFNLFNVVNMGLPANTLVGAGFGEISKTAGTSRQIQLSLKLIY